MTPTLLQADLPRIFVIAGRYYPDAMESHIVETLRDMGYPVGAFATDSTLGGLPTTVRKAIIKSRSLLRREPERSCEKALLRAASAFNPSLILVIHGSQLSPKTIALLRSHIKAPIVCWCQDAMTQFGRQYLLGAGYDVVFVKDRYLQDVFSRMIRSTRFFYLAEACNPRMHRRVELSPSERKEFECDVMIMGTFYYYRQEILRQLLEFDLKIWGSVPDWLLNRMPGRLEGREVFAEDKVRAVAGARIALNTLHYAEVGGLNCRAFELAGCGGFQLISSVSALAEHFTPDREIVAFRTTDELIEKTRYYLRHDSEAQAIARRGQLRAYREHTYAHRLAEIMRLSLGCDTPSSSVLPPEIPSAQATGTLSDAAALLSS